MTDAKPYPKAQQLARGERRYRRKVASPKQWASIRAAKLGPCRVCGVNRPQLHHVVPRSSGGDDVADNMTPLCPDCHLLVGTRSPIHCRLFVANLTDAEYAYAVEKGGEQVFERVYGITYTR